MNEDLKRKGERPRMPTESFRPIEDRVLLAIIDAHPPRSPPIDKFAAIQQREDRLAKAKLALLGRSSPRGPRKIDDGQMLWFMANERMRDRSVASMRKIDPSAFVGLNDDRSIAELARAAILRFGAKGHSVDAMIERLGKKFAERSEQDLLDATLYPDEEIALEDHHALLLAVEALCAAGIPAELRGVG
jgi:hypothetical protein